MIKRNESDVGNFDFEILAKTVFKYWQPLNERTGKSENRQTREPPNPRTVLVVYMCSGLSITHGDLEPTLKIYSIHKVSNSYNNEDLFG